MSYVSNTVSAQFYAPFSQNQSELVKALAAAQIEFKEVKRTVYNEFVGAYYAELCDYIEATKEAMAKHGLSLIHSSLRDPHGNYVMMSTLLHTSSEWARAFWPVSENPTADRCKPVQARALEHTYGKKNNLMALLNIAAKGEDDDGNSAEKAKELNEKQVAAGLMTIDQAKALAKYIKDKSKGRLKPGEVMKNIASSFDVTMIRDVRADKEKECYAMIDALIRDLPPENEEANADADS